ncbi:MAG: hypothetical protein ACK5PP_10445 [Acidimicrobiales bacterium]
MKLVSDRSLDPWADVVGHVDALARLEAAAASPVHAYLFVGSQGSGSYPVALGFGGLILAGGEHDPTSPDARHIALARQAKHPDLVVIEPEGSTIRVAEADQIIRAGLRSPMEGDRKVIVVRGIDAIEEAAIGKLLKVVEEPPESAVFVLLAEEIPPELITIASRCVTIEFAPLPVPVIAAALIERGVNSARAEAAAVASGGDMARAELLVGDDGLAARAEMWRQVPQRLDGTGSTVVAIVNELRAGMDHAQEPLEVRHAEEKAALEERVEQLGERGSGRAELVARHKRELRRLRADELRFGLATLARTYRDRLVDGDDRQPVVALDHIQTTAEHLIRNPNEALLLQALLLRCGPETAP